MAIAIDSSGSTKGTSVSSLTTPAWTCAGANRFLIAGMAWSGGSPPNYTAIKWGGSGGTSLTQVGSTYSFQTYYKSAIARLIAPDTGSNTLYGQISGTTDELFVGGSTWTGVDQSTPLDTPAQANGASGTASVNVSSATNDVVVDFMYTSSITITKDASQTLIWEQENAGDGYCGFGHSYEVGAATVTMSWTFDANAWGITGVSINPASATELTVSGGSHTHTISSATIWQRSHPVIASCQHGHNAESLVLSQRQEISISGASHGHVAESLNLNQSTGLSISDNSHTHIIVDISLLQRSDLTISDAVHSHAIDAINLSQRSELSIVDAVHNHNVQEITLIPITEISGSTCWGHVTGVLEDNVRTFATNWAGTGTVDNSGDAERLILVSGEYMESELINTGAAYIELLQNHYTAGSDGTLKYRHGATQGDCTAASWNDYIVPFDSLGYVQIRIEV